MSPEEFAKALKGEPLPPKEAKKLRKVVGKALKLRMSKQVKMFLQTLPPDEQKALIDQFEKIAQDPEGQGVKMTPEERATFESEEGVDLDAMVKSAEDDTEN